jgi:hypothetical protein
MGKRHNHKASEKLWNEAGETDRGRFAAIGKPGYDYHGYCQVTGTHMIDAYCACGARRFVGNGTCPRRWVGGDDDDE